ncbi:elongation of very long chain fatty acids protein AAEL008004 isoform X1 [Eurytemora carolleeae]|uniref:elongation of very long chain fatty acids protein AAEL008004 isoform X1 n=1 Tax=Eurytemora carolleeae TaxID=1294199 RepID=UPI000C76A562|nr:elongation of very long chain fatty acids protein AAEL008004 isoform X1 [Eurytemora carolleeae]|eukprot:XP_023340268.1 elongation of very long chain fatty acids protein AAEL008004-like isoform X1 [Eurytemora affinis]
MDKLELEDVLREEGRIDKRVEDYLSSLHLINQSEPRTWSQIFYDKIQKHSDPRVDNWLMMDSPVYTLVLSSLYLIFILLIGPAYMKHRSAYTLKYPMIVYNLAQTLFNAWVLKEGLKLWFSGEYNWICQPVDYSTSKQGMLAVNMAWWFYMSKFTDFVDSFFFVLRKKNNQLTFLHVVHHSSMPVFSWFGPKFAGGGHTSFGGTWNMLVHVIMYFYYFLAAAGVKRELLWWKKYLTGLQMVQFVAVILHAMFPLVLSDCNYPKEMSFIIIFNGALYFVLFWKFYKKSYSITPSKPANKQE